jgi:drug/metabolite transporter (DMT)-like permease
VTGSRRRGQLYAVLAALAWSSAGVLQRQVTASVATQIAGRSAFAFVALTAFAMYSQQPTGGIFNRPSLGVAAAMAVANGCFLLALNYGSVADALFFQSLSPVGAAVLGIWWLDERPDSVTVAATFAATLGIAIMVGGPGGGGVDAGNAFGFLAALAFIVVIVIGRRQRGGSTAAAIGLGQLLLVVASAPWVKTAGLTPANVGWLALLGIAQIGLGSGFFAAAARRLPAAELGLILLAELLLGPLWTWIGVSERPNTSTLVGGGIAFASVAAQFAVRRKDPVEDTDRAR